MKQAFKKSSSLFTRFLLFVFLLFLAFTATACKKQTDYTQYVSEYRNNLFLYDGDGFSVRAQSVEREYPYVADGNKGEMTKRVELFISAPIGTQSCSVFFHAGGLRYGGEASFDNVKNQYYFSCTADLSSARSLPIALTFDSQEFEVTVPSVLTDDMIPLQQLIERVFESDGELLKRLTAEKNFDGELYVRILYEDAPYFYVGVVDKSGNITAFLLEAKTGKVLAKRHR